MVAFAKPIASSSNLENNLLIFGKTDFSPQHVNTLQNMKKCFVARTLPVLLDPLDYVPSSRICFKLS